MTDKDEIVRERGTCIITPAVTRIWLRFEATVSTSDTVTVDALTSILNAVLTKKSDGSNITFTKATNILKVTQADLTDVEVTGYAEGT